MNHASLRRALPALGLLLLLLLLLAAGTLLGSCRLPCAEWRINGEWNPILQLRFLRTCAALVIGGSLAVAGLTFQAVLRNALAEPFTLGISGGAGVGAALAFLFGWHAVHPLLTPAAAFAGALLTLILVLTLNHWGKRGAENLLLCGVITGTVAGSMLTYLLSIARADELTGITWWLLGDLQCPDPQLLVWSAVILTGGTALLCGHAHALNALSLGESEAWNLGIDHRRLTGLAVLTASLLAAQTVALAGMIGFCGLIIPHVVRALLGCDHRRILLPVLFAGAAFLAFCDLVSRLLVPEREIPIGVMTALIGGPFFLWLLNRRRTR